MLRTSTRRVTSSLSRTVVFARCLNTQSGAVPFPEKLAFAFDIDGVLKQGHHNVLPEAKRVLQLLSGGDGRLSKPIPFLLITNGGGVPDEERRAALSSELGVQLGPDQLVQSHTPLRDYVKPYREKPVLVIGGAGESCRRVAESYGLKHAYIPQDVIKWKPAIWDRTALTEEEEAFARPADFSQIPLSAVFVMHDTHDWGRDIALILDTLSAKDGILGTKREHKSDQGEVELVLSNADVEWRSDWPIPRLGQGAFRLSLEAVYKATTGLELPYKQFGKPFKATYDFSELSLRRYLSSVGRNPDIPLNVYMVGDNPASDIAGANAHGWSSILVRTGVFSDENGETPEHKPTVIMDDVEKGVEWAIRRETGRIL
ncbi:TIGR01456 family HAD hydrolase [Kwoniella shandongensis]|uniref:TIGR01456 family HAD hydrolase n=1 Tax=Kwoniella shandongensis TaxID=1734106 RepID=A0A5M6BXQ0_9TREE|nr:TIGR01456 family HAD hydrolase [Kwoniella shandongensis]KAA5527111.1 TIGR01456 family HAD hydrolase [Kwoniella shandongensis]